MEFVRIADKNVSAMPVLHKCRPAACLNCHGEHVVVLHAGPWSWTTVDERGSLCVWVRESHCERVFALNRGLV